MADEKTPASDPSSSSYGATVQNPPYPTADTTAYPTPQPPMPPPVGSPPYPTPQMNQEAPLNNFPTEPPPKYEPPKGAYPPQQPYPPSGMKQRTDWLIWYYHLYFLQSIHLVEYIKCYYSGTPFERPPRQEATPSGKAN